jgi:1,4-dihydroxy-2-naphthoyl-CoA hydrolase
MSLSEELNNRGTGTLPGLIGIEILEVDEDRLTSRLELRDELMAPNGYLHAATIVALADTSCGYGCFVNLPDGARGFTTVELKSNRKAPPCGYNPAPSERVMLGPSLSLTGSEPP